LQRYYSNAHKFVFVAQKYRRVRLQEHARALANSLKASAQSQMAVKKDGNPSVAAVSGIHAGMHLVVDQPKCKSNAHLRVMSFSSYKPRPIRYNTIANCAWETCS